MVTQGRKHSVETLEFRWNARVAQPEHFPAGRSERPSAKAPASERPLRPFWGV